MVRAVGRLILWDADTDLRDYVEAARIQGHEDESRGLEWLGFYYRNQFFDAFPGMDFKGLVDFEDVSSRAMQLREIPPPPGDQTLPGARWTSREPGPTSCGRWGKGQT